MEQVPVVKAVSATYSPNEGGGVDTTVLVPRLDLHARAKPPGGGYEPDTGAVRRVADDTLHGLVEARIRAMLAGDEIAFLEAQLAICKSGFAVTDQLQRDRTDVLVPAKGSQTACIVGKYPWCHYRKEA